jgi:hypothetical protein
VSLRKGEADFANDYICARTTSSHFFFCKLKKSAPSECWTAKMLNISTTMAKKRPRVDENRVQEALKDCFDNRNKSIAQTAKEYGMKSRTLQNRINGLPAETGKKGHNHALSEIQEQVLKYWIKRLDNYNLSHTKEMVVEYVNAILKHDNLVK